MALNLFRCAQTKFLPGQLHTRGIGLRRQATIFRLRGAVLFAEHENGPGIWARPRGLTLAAEEDFPGARSRAATVIYRTGDLWYFAFRSRYCRSAGDFHESQRAEYALTTMGSLGILEAAGPGSGAFWKWQFRIDDLVGSGKIEATLSLFAVRRIQLKIVASWRNGAPG